MDFVPDESAINTELIEVGSPGCSGITNLRLQDHFCGLRSRPCTLEHRADGLVISCCRLTMRLWTCLRLSTWPICRASRSSR